MKIKEICERTGLTDRTVRFYIEEQLIAPFYTENYLGRKSFDFSEGDLEKLKDIATLRSFGFSVDEIKELIFEKEDNEKIVEEVRKRAEKSLDESSKRVHSLSRISLTDETNISDIARQLSAANLPIEDTPANTNIKKAVLSFISASVVFLAVWLPIALSASILICKLFTVQAPIIQVGNAVYTLLSLLPSLSILFVLRRIKGSAKVTRIIFTSLCALCIPLAIIFSSQSVKQCDHSYEMYRTVVEATCKNEGEQIEKCRTCGDLSTTRMDVLPHNAVVVQGVSPTCGADGITDGSYCSFCSEVLADQTIIPATGIHTPVVDPARSADCENVGLTEGSHCSVCGETLVEQISSPALGHSYTEQIVNPTCQVNGYTLHQCTCGSTYMDNYVQPTVYHEFVRASDSADKGRCRVCGLKVISYGNADGLAIGGNDAIKYYLTGTNDFSYGKTLVIYGSGDMPDYSINNPPWIYFANQIKTIIIEEDITSIGNNAFTDKEYSNTGMLIIRSKYLKNINISECFSGISTVLCEIIFDF